MKPKHSNITMAVLIFLLAMSLIWNLIFQLPSVSTEIAKLIYSNTITHTLVNIYWDGLPSLISIPVSFANIIYAIMALHSVYKSKIPNKKSFIGYLIYATISLGALVIHCMTFYYIFSCLVAG